jgi:acyl-CoA dehydrogenase
LHSLGSRNGPRRPSISYDVCLPRLVSYTNAPLQVEKFVDEECLPADAVYAAQLGEGAERWSAQPSVLEDLKEKAKKVGIWNMFLPKNHFKEGAGFSNLEYGLMAEELGKSRTASEVC